MSFVNGNKSDHRKQIMNIIATMSFEGIHINDDTIELCEKVLDGKMSGDEARQIIYNKYRIEG